MAKQTSTLPQYQYKRKHGFFYNLKKYRVLTLMCVPAIVFFFAFNYMPLQVSMWHSLSTITETVFSEASL